MYVNTMYLNVGVNFSGYVFFFPFYLQKKIKGNSV